MSEHAGKASSLAVCQPLRLGCQRSADEIRRWGLMSNDERRDVLQRCGERARLGGQLM